jgi:hypothetical protein
MNGMVRYPIGGTTKRVIVPLLCGPFTCQPSLYHCPTAGDQYRNSQIVSATQMKTGIGIFNTTGGISHWFYLQNNKFVHASRWGNHQ